MECSDTVLYQLLKSLISNNGDYSRQLGAEEKDYRGGQKSWLVLRWTRLELEQRQERLAMRRRRERVVMVGRETVGDW